MMNPFRLVDLIPNSESRSSFQPEGYDSETENVDGILQETYTLEWESDDKFSSCDILVIGTSKEGSQFLATFLTQEVEGKKNVLASVKFGSRYQDRFILSKIQVSDDLKNKSIASIKLSNDTTILGLRFENEKVPPIKMIPIAKSIIKQLNPKNVVILDSLIRHEFKSAELNVDEIEIPMLYKLRTNALTESMEEGSTTEKIPTLASTNIISDIGAAILTLCQLKSIHAIMLISLTEGTYNAASVKAYSKGWPVPTDQLRNTRLRSKYSEHESLYL